MAPGCAPSEILVVLFGFADDLPARPRVHLHGRIYSCQIVPEGSPERRWASSMRS